MKKLLFVFLTLATFSYAQFSFSPEVVYIQPIGGFSGWFDSHYSGTLYIGRVKDGSFLAGRIEFYKFHRENTDKLFYKDLELKLTIYGAGAEYRHRFWKLYFIDLYGLVGTGIYRWFGVRGEYFFKDSFGNVIDYISENRQQDWSAGFCSGLGIELSIFKNLSFNSNIRYEIILGEMWQALALRLEQASGFQWIGVQAGIQFKF